MCQTSRSTVCSRVNWPPTYDLVSSIGLSDLLQQVTVRLGQVLLYQLLIPIALAAAAIDVVIIFKAGF